MNLNWVETITADPELPARMLEYFPDDTRILRHQFWHYYDAVNCDSVTYYGNRLKTVWESGTSDYLRDMSANFNEKHAIEDLEQRINDICVEGVAKEKKELGMSEL